MAVLILSERPLAGVSTALLFMAALVSDSVVVFTVLFMVPALDSDVLFSMTHSSTIHFTGVIALSVLDMDLTVLDMDSTALVLAAVSVL
jgi:hypothetical protein